MRKVRLFSLFFIILIVCGCRSNAPSTTRPAPAATTASARATATATPPALAKLSKSLAKKSAHVDELFHEFIEEDAPGAAVIVIRKGEIVHSAGYGLANLKTGDPITPSHLFHIASIGKQFTALGIMMLYEEGKLDYDDPLVDYLPELEWLSDKVTIRRLLYHTSGLPNYGNDNDIAEKMLELADAPGNAELLEVLADGEYDVEYRPGNKYSYNNTGYDMLGILIERLSGQSYAEFMQERVFDPVGMTHTFVLPNPAKRASPMVAISYPLKNGKPVPYVSDPWDNLPGSGAIYSSVEDLYFYDQALYIDDLVEQETLEEAFTTGYLNNGNEIDYGFGWETGEYNDEWYVGHSGWWLAFDSYFLRFPDDELSIIVLYNWDYGDTDAETAAFEIADIYQ